MNKVISREYVEKNYIPKSELANFVDKELNIIEQYQRKDVSFLLNCEYEAIKAVYKAIKNIFLEGTKDGNK